MRKLTVASFFAGVGGIDLGFEETGMFETVYANEIDPMPVKTYEQNFPIKVDNKDIRKAMPEDIPDVDVIVGGFPCQAFSIAGLRQGFDDEKGRGTLFFELIRLIHAKKPKVVFFENVKNLVSHDNGNTLKVIMKSLQKEGYNASYKVMNACEYGNVPQNRERIYIIGFRNDIDGSKFEFPEKTALTTTLQDIINFNAKVDDRYYYKEGKHKCDIFEKLKAETADKNAVYQWRRHYVRKNMRGLIPTLTANMGGGGHNVPIVTTDTGIRKLTPRECFNAQGFPEAFVLPTDTADTWLYKQAGNSVCVSVIERIAENIWRAIS